MINKTTIERQFNNIKVKFINVPVEYDKVCGKTFAPKTVKKLKEFERLIISDLCNSNMGIEVDFEKPYHAIGYDWIIPEYECVECGKVYQVADMKKIIVSDKEERICEECYRKELNK